MDLDRRKFLSLLGATAAVTLAGCNTSDTPLSSEKSNNLKDAANSYKESGVNNASAAAILVLASKLSDKPMEEIINTYNNNYYSTMNAEASAILVFGSVITNTNIEEMSKLYRNVGVNQAVASAYLAVAAAVESNRTEVCKA